MRKTQFGSHVKDLGRAEACSTQAQAQAVLVWQLARQQMPYFYSDQRACLITYMVRNSGLTPLIISRSHIVYRTVSGSRPDMQTLQSLMSLYLVPCGDLWISTAEKGRSDSIFPVGTPHSWWRCAQDPQPGSNKSQAYTNIHASYQHVTSTHKRRRRVPRPRMTISTTASKTLA